MLSQVTVWKDNVKHCNIPVDVISGRPHASLVVGIPTQMPFYVFAQIHQWIKDNQKSNQYGPWKWDWQKQAA